MKKIEYKKCASCEEVKSTDLFFKDSHLRSGFTGSCKACISKRAKDRYEKIKPKRLEQMSKYFKLTAEKVNELIDVVNELQNFVLDEKNKRLDLVEQRQNMEVRVTELEKKLKPAKWNGHSLPAHWHQPKEKEEHAEPKISKEMQDLLEEVKKLDPIDAHFDPINSEEQEGSMKIKDYTPKSGDKVKIGSYEGYVDPTLSYDRHSDKPHFRVCNLTSCMDVYGDSEMEIIVLESGSGS